jgi:hypothetical protein
VPYTLKLHYGEVVRDSDGKVVAPCQNADDPDFLAYLAWVEEGNAPTVDETPLPPVLEPVPEAVTPYQARKALLASGMLDQVEALMAQAPREAQLAWEYAIEVRRDDPFIALMAGQLGLTDAQVDDLFRLAATL